MNILHHKEYGDRKNKSLFIIHGLFGSLDNWQSHALVLAENFHVVSVDLRNHAKSFHSDEMNLQVMVEDILHLQKYLTVSKFYAIGHSLGGKVLMKMLQQSQDIEKAIVVDIAPRLYNRGHDLIFQALRSVDLENTNRRNEIEMILQDAISDTATLQFIMKSLSRNEDGTGFHWKFNLHALYENYNTLISKITFTQPISTPTLFIKGAQSNYISDQDKIEIAKAFLNVKFIEIKNAGHWVHAENPIDFRYAVLDFLLD